MQVYQFSVGDSVQVCDDATKVRGLQKGHGEWIDSMRNVSDLFVMSLFWVIVEYIYCSRCEERKVSDMPRLCYRCT